MTTNSSSRTKTPIKEMMTLARKMKGVISLGQGMPNVRYPQFILEEIQKLIANNDFNKYSDLAGLYELKEAVAKHIQEKYSEQIIDPEKNILITCGAMEATMAALLSIIEPQDEVIVFSPYYPSHKQQIILAGGIPVPVELDVKNDWRIDHKKLQEAITKQTKAIIICNPSNPTGTVFSREDIKKIVNICKKNNIFIINDETYNFLVFNKEKFCSPLEFPNDIKNQLISCFSFSKEFAMTGLRVGYMLAPESVVGDAAGIHDALTICAPTLSQKIALIMLKHKEKWATQYFQDFIEKREIMIKGLNEIGEQVVTFSLPEGAYYAFVNYKSNIPSEELAKEILFKAKVITIPGSGFGENGEYHFRLSFSGDNLNIKQGVERLGEYLKKLPK